MNEPARGHRLEAAGIRQFPHAFMTSTREATVLAFDFGTRRIGVAVGNTLVRVAHPLATIEGDANDDALRCDRGADRRMATRPARRRHSRCTPMVRDHDMTLRARRFARQLAGRFRLPVIEVDERYTTAGGRKSELAQAGHGGRRGRAQRDEVAAQLILQAYFDEPRPD